MEIVFFGMIGLLAGMVGGLLGVGGSIVMIPALTEFFGPRQHLYQAAAMIVNFCVVAPAIAQHWRARAIDWPLVAWMAPLAVIGVAAGVWVSELTYFRGHGQAGLIILFGVFLLGVAGRHLHRLLRGQAAHAARPSDAPAPPGWFAGLLAGCPTGFVGGLLGVGGGVICVPLQLRLLAVPLRSAIANSATTILGLSLVGAVLKNYALSANHADATVTEAVRLAAALAPTAIIGSIVGSRLTHVLPLRWLRIALIGLLVVAALRMLHHGQVAWAQSHP